MTLDPQAILDRLLQLQSKIRDAVLHSRGQSLSAAVRATSADTIYAIDAVVEPIIDSFCDDWSRITPLILIAEGVESRDPAGNTIEGEKVFPAGARAQDAQIRIILDPIDGTRSLMYDKRSAWSLAAAAPNRGPTTRLRDAVAAAMTELPTTKMCKSDVLSTIAGQPARGYRVDLLTGSRQPLAIAPSTAADINHGFATVSNFFPGTKRLAAEMMEHIATRLLDPADLHRATVFDDQYISTGGQFYELIVGHDRFNADLRPEFYRAQEMSPGMCCHPYDCAALLIAESAGVIITNQAGNPLDAPLDTTTPISWLAYANPSLRALIEPVAREFLSAMSIR